MMLGAALALAVTAVVAVWQPFVGLLVYLWFDFMRPHDFFVELCALRPMLVIALATLAGTVWQHRRRLLDGWTQLLPVLALVAAVGVSTIGSLDPALSAGTLVEIVKMLVLVWLLAVLVSTETRFDAVLWVIALSLLVLAVSAVVQGIDRGLVHEFRIDRVATGPPGAHGGPFWDNNDLARVLVLSAPLWWVLMVRYRGIWLRLLATAGLLTTVAGIEFTFSRGGFVALLTAVVVVAFFYRPWWRASLIPLLFLGGVLVLSPRPYLERIATIGNAPHESSIQKRVDVWQDALAIAMEHWFEGQGPGTFRAGAARRTSHNIFLEVLAEMGVIGLAAYLWVIGAALLALHRVRRRAGSCGDAARVQTASWGLQAALLAFLTASMALSHAFQSPPFVIIGLALALSRRLERAPHRQGHHPWLLSAALFRGSIS